MDPQLLQSLRHKLQKRFRRLNAVYFTEFDTVLQQFFGFLDANTEFHGILQELGNRHSDLKSRVDSMIQHGGPPVKVDSEEKDAALSYWLLLKCCSSATYPEVVNIYKLDGADQSGDKSRKLTSFRKQFLKPFYDYLDEQLDDQNMVLRLLLRYKQSCEWFRRDKLNGYVACAEEAKDPLPPRRERPLARDLHRFLHEQGLEIYVEPKSGCGEPDFVLSNAVAEAKVFSGDKGRITRGFAQLHTDTCSLNRSFGYLVVFKVCEEGIQFHLPGSGDVPNLVHNNKTFFFVVIDICKDRETSSRQKKLKEVLITTEDLVSEVIQIT